MREKIFRYCAYQERAHQEVKNKLYEYGLHSSQVDEMIVELISQGFLNEERFAKAFAGGKFRLKSWGRMKIIHALEGKGVTPNCIKSGLKEIDDDSYVRTLQDLISKKWQLIDSEDIFVKRDKVATYVIQKGYEPEMVWKMLKEDQFS